MPLLRPALALAAVATLLAHAGHWRDGWVDDAFITFRYARNFAAGDGMVFNPGDAFEGITNLGWALLVAPFSGGDVLLVSQICGLLAGAATVLVLADWARRAGLGIVATGAVLASMTVAPWPAYWLLQGLETPIVMLALTVGWSRYRTEATDGGAVLAGPALGVAPWLRPDGALLSVLVGAWHLYTRGLPRGRALLSVGIVSAAALALVGLKLAWYGAILPNTFHVKVDHFPPDRGVSYLESFFTVPNPWFAVVLAIACAWGLWRATYKDDRALPAVVFVAYLFAAVLQNGDFFANFRLLVPAWPAACAALGLAVEALGAAVPRVGGVVRVAAAVGIGLALVPLSRVGGVDHLDSKGGPGRVPLKTVAFWAPWKAPTWASERRDQMPFPAAWALVNVGPTDVVAYSELGLLSFIQEGPVLDMLGLTDPVIAGRGGEDWKQQVAYVNGRADAMVISTTAGLWPRWRSVLAADGWLPEAACDGNWVFRNPTLPLAPPDDAELDRRLDLALARAPRMAGLHLAIARELAAAGGYAATHAAPLLAELDARGLVSAGDLQRARCDVGVGEGCTPRRTCERGSPRLAGAEMGDATRWPAYDPALAPSQATTAGPALGPDGQALSAPPLADADAVAPPTLPEGCEDARTSASDAWEDLGKRWPREAPFDELRRASRQAARAARSGASDMAELAARAAAASPDVLTTVPELAAALGEARRRSEGAAASCE